MRLGGCRAVMRTRHDGHSANPPASQVPQKMWPQGRNSTGPSHGSRHTPHVMSALSSAWVVVKVAEVMVWWWWKGARVLW